MKPITIGLLGLGTVGQSLVELVRQQPSSPDGRPSVIVKQAIVKDLAKKREVGIPISQDVEDILDDREIDIIVDVMGGLEPARHYIETALQRGKSVVTANKEVMAYAGDFLRRLAYRENKQLLFEASVGGGIPIIDSLIQHMRLAPISAVRGVLNGTTNFILSTMEQGISFENALELAKQKGYAEANPSNDLNGQDATRKLVLLARIAFDVEILPENVPTIGIQTIDVSTIGRLQNLGFGVRLVAQAQKVHNSIRVSVGPVILPHHHRFLQLEGPQNGIEIMSEAGQFYFEGPGAGGFATATSVLSDIYRAHYQTLSTPVPPLSHLPIHSMTGPWGIFSIDPERQLPDHLPRMIKQYDNAFGVFEDSLPNLGDGISQLPLMFP